MKIADFALERYLARWEFSAPHLLCTSDVEPYKLDELLALADDDARARFAGLSLGYTEPSGHPALRREVAALYEGVAPDDVLMFAGAEEALFVLSNVILERGSHAVVVAPCYQALHELPRALGADVTLVRLAPEGAWQLDLAAVRAAVRPTTRLIVTNFPHSPTGALADAALMRGLGDIAREAGAVLLGDEVYRHLEHEPGSRAAAAVEVNDRAVSVGVMSKAFGLAGLRIGWIVTRDAALLRRAAHFKDYTTICNSAPSEQLALIALRARDRVLARSLSIVRSNLTRLSEFFAAHADVFDWIPPRAGTVAFPRLRAGGSADDFTRAVRDAEGVLLLPGSVFDAESAAHFRVGFGRASMPQALERLARFMTTYRARA